MRFARGQETPPPPALTLDLYGRRVGDSKLDLRSWRVWMSWAVIGSVVASAVSIAASGILLGAAGALWVTGSLHERRFDLKFPPFGWALIAFAGAVLLSIAFSSDPAYSARYLTKAVKLLLVLLVWNHVSRKQMETAFKAIFVVLGLSAVYGILQYAWLLDVNLLNRIRGFMSHWMTFSGQMMMGVVGLSCYLALSRFGDSGSPDAPKRGERLFWWAVLLALLTALLLTFTRNAWLGTLTGLGGLLLLVNRRLIVPAVLALALLWLFLPPAFHERVLDSFDLRDTTTQSRLELLRTGAAMVADHPWTGVGPRMVPIAAAHYRSNQEFPGWLYQHLHNTPVQIAAEMGLVGLAAWLLLWGVLLRDFLRMARNGARRDWMGRFASANALCLSLAFLAAGLLEYNFGDSELLNLMVFFVLAPYVLTNREAAAL